MMSVHSPVIRRALHRNSPATCRSSSLWPSAELSFCHRPVSLRTLTGLSPALLPGAHHALPSLALSRSLLPLPVRLLTGLSPVLLPGARHALLSPALSRALSPLSLRLLTGLSPALLPGALSSCTTGSIAWRLPEFMLASSVHSALFRLALFSSTKFIPQENLSVNHFFKKFFYKFLICLFLQLNV